MLAALTVTVFVAEITALYTKLAFGETTLSITTPLVPAPVTVIGKVAKAFVATDPKSSVSPPKRTLLMVEPELPPILTDPKVAKLVTVELLEYRFVVSKELQEDVTRLLEETKVEPTTELLKVVITP